VRRFPVELFYFLVAGVYLLFIFNIEDNNISKKIHHTTHTTIFHRKLTHPPPASSFHSSTQSINISLSVMCREMKKISCA
jgi:hypothetical protein